MSYQVKTPDFISPTYTEEKQRRFEKYYESSKDIEFKELYCPNCNIHIGDKFEGANWYQPFKCPKCKGVFIFDLSEFRTLHGYGYKKYLWQKEVGIC